MSSDILYSVAGEGAELGVSIIVIAGGEPFFRKDDLFHLAKAHPKVLFPVFTNGMLIDEDICDKIASYRNIVPIISIEGFREETDLRRGNGVYDKILGIFRILKERSIFFGCSVTISRNNFKVVTSAGFVSEIMNNGARVLVYVEYVPIDAGTEDMMLRREDKKDLQKILSDYNREFSSLFIGFPGDENYYGGCLAAGRGFVHISPSGDLEPCPAAPYSDTNISHVSLKEALKSGLICRIRKSPGVLNEYEGGCALRTNMILTEEFAKDQLPNNF